MKMIPPAAALALGLTLASCASHKVVTPNGRGRVPVNSPASLSQYQDLVERDQAGALEKSELQRRVESLTAQVAALKTYVYSTQKGAEADAAQSLAAPLPIRSPLRDSTPAAEMVVGEVMVVGTSTIVFRVNHPIGGMEFAPSPPFKEALLKAAREAKSISVRGRSDGGPTDPEPLRIALGRAIQARQFLVRSGVDPNKIRTWYRTVGALTADNSIPEGRAQNRRVEIEVRGIDTSGIAPVTPDLRVGRNP